jgi:gliding motility-associated-like protein
MPQYSGPIASYNWSPVTNNLNCNTCANVNGLAQVTDSYSIIVNSINGCIASDSISITVLCNEANLFVPTAFTPNGDGINDYFYPMTRGFNNVVVFKVWNRYGQLLFERKNFRPNNAQLGWNGYFKGLPITNAQGLVWYIEATCDQGSTIKKKGTTVLLN